MEWIKIQDEKIDLNRIHFLVDGDSIFISGTQLQPFCVQLAGEMKDELNFTHWMPLPKPPKE